MYALNNSAKEVVSIDSSKTAMELVAKNVILNFGSSAINHHSICDDVFHFFKISDLISQAMVQMCSESLNASRSNKAGLRVRKLRFLPMSIAKLRKYLLF